MIQKLKILRPFRAISFVRLNNIVPILACIFVLTSPNALVAQELSEIDRNKKLNDFVVAEKFDDAMLWLNELLADSPEDVELLEMRSETWYHKKEYDKALQDIERAIALDSTNHNLLFTKSLIYGGMGKVEEAVQSCKPIIDAIRNNHPNDETSDLAIICFLTNAGVLNASGDTNRALKMIDELSARYPEIPLSKVFKTLSTDNYYRNRKLEKGD